MQRHSSSDAREWMDQALVLASDAHKQVSGFDIVTVDVECQAVETSFLVTPLLTASCKLRRLVQHGVLVAKSYS